MKKNKQARHVDKKALSELLEALVLLKSTEDVHAFLKDLCSPQELKALSERWRVCQFLDQGELSYREIHRITGSSLVTIGRVARFLNTEPHKGYQLVLDKMRDKKKAIEHE